MRITRAPILAMLLLLVGCGVIPVPVIEQAPPDVEGWPGTRAEPAGRYSWDMASDRFMHNVTNPGGQLAMRFHVSEIAPLEDGVPTTVAGYAATFEESEDGLSRTWLADIGGTIVQISATAEAGTPPAIAAQAQAIMDSLRLQLDEDSNEILTFTLPAGWDSG